MIQIRSLALPLAGLILVIALWGCAGSSGGKTAGARGPGAGRPPVPAAWGPTLAVVDGVPITRHDVDSVLASAPASVRENYMEDEEQYKLLVERIAQQQAIYLAARKAGMENDAGYRADVEAQKRQILLKHYYQSVVQSLPPITNAEVERYYDAHPTEFAQPARVRVRHIQVRTQAGAREVVKRLRSATWESVCAQYSTDKVTAKSGGVLGFVSPTGDDVPGVGKAPAIVAAAFNLKEGETSAPLKSGRGWHVIRVDQKAEAGPQPLKNVERQIRGSLESDRSEHFQETLVDSLKRTYGVIVYDDSISVAMKPVLSPAQLFGKAQAAASPQERISLFKEVVTRYPNDKSAVQAAFMVGFTYAEELADFPAARSAFQDFLRKYPKSDLVASANWMLENMEHSAPPPGLTPDQLHFETIQGSDTLGTKSKP